VVKDYEGLKKYNIQSIFEATKQGETETEGADKSEGDK
jgi:hypothetical protein